MSGQASHKQEERPYWDTLQKSEQEIAEELMEARRGLCQSQAREEAFHRLMSREVAERDRMIAKIKQTSTILTALVLLLVLTVAGQITYIKSLHNRLQSQRATMQQRMGKQPAILEMLPRHPGADAQPKWGIV